MSNKVTRIQEKLEKEYKRDVYDMQNSIVGSIVASIAILNSDSEEEAVSRYRDLRSDDTFRPKNILETVEMVIDRYGKREDLEHLCLVTDKEGLRTPGVFPYLEEEKDQEKLLVPCPLTRDWTLSGILLYFYNNPEKCDLEVLKDYV